MTKFLHIAAPADARWSDLGTELSLVTALQRGFAFDLLLAELAVSGFLRRITNTNTNTRRQAN